MELGSLSRLLLAKLATEIRADQSVGRADPGGALTANVARSSSGALPQSLPQRAGTDSAAPSSSSLSPTGRLVAQLLRNDPAGSAAPQFIASADPIVGDTVVPQSIAQSLARVVSESGLFYESHLLEWTQGKRELETLLREPQARLGAPASTTPHPTAGSADANALRPPATAAGHLTNESTGHAADTRTPIAAAGPHEPVARDRTESNRFDERAPDTSSAEARGATSEPRMPAEAARIARHQLDALAAEQIVWRGMLRAEQPGEIEIGREQRAAGGEAPEVWRARLALELPQLGRVEVALALDSGNLSLAFRADEHARAALAVRADALQTALAAQALPVHAVQFLAPRPLPEPHA